MTMITITDDNVEDVVNMILNDDDMPMSADAGASVSSAAGSSHNATHAGISGSHDYENVNMMLGNPMFYVELKDDLKSVFRDKLVQGYDVLGLVRHAGDCSLSRYKSSRAVNMKCYAMLSSYGFIEFDENKRRNGMIVIDIDCDDAEFKLAYACNHKLVPMPSLYVVNPVNNHVQVFYKYVAYDNDGSDASKNRDALLTHITDSMTRVLHGDSHFSHHRFKNPYAVDKYRIMMPSGYVDRAFDANMTSYGPNDDNPIFNSKYIPCYSLRAIADYMDEAGVYNNGRSGLHSRRLVNHVVSSYVNSNANNQDVPGGVYDSSDVYSQNQVVTEGSRNDTVFKVAVRAAYNGLDVSKAAHSVVCNPPLSEKELRVIIKSAKKEALKNRNRKTTNNSKSNNSHKYVSTLDRNIHGLLSELGRKGGNANTDLQVATRTRNLNRGSNANKLRRLMNRDKIMHYLMKGGSNAYKFLKAGGRFHSATMKHIADVIGVSVITVKRCIADIVRMLRSSCKQAIRDGFMTDEELKRINDNAHDVYLKYGQRASIGYILSEYASMNMLTWLFNNGYSMLAGEVDNDMIMRLFRMEFRDIRRI